MNIPMQVHRSIVNALTEYDRSQSKRKDYNRWALGHYFNAWDSAQEDVARGVDLMDAIGRAFTGRLHDCVARAARNAMEKSGIRD